MHFITVIQNLLAYDKKLQDKKNESMRDDYEAMFA